MTATDHELNELVAAAHEGDRSGIRRTGQTDPRSDLHVGPSPDLLNEEDARRRDAGGVPPCLQGAEELPRRRAVHAPGSTGSPPTTRPTFLSTRTRHRHEDLGEVHEPADPSHEADVEMMAGSSDSEIGSTSRCPSSRQAARRRRAAGRLRPAPRGHRRQLGHLGLHRQGPPASCPPSAAGACTPTSARSTSVRCDGLAPHLSEVTDGSVLLPRPAHRHVEHCLDARPTSSLPADPPRPAIHADRGARAGPRPGRRHPGPPRGGGGAAGDPFHPRQPQDHAYIGGIAAATAATATGAIIVAVKSRRSRVRLAS